MSDNATNMIGTTKGRPCPAALFAFVAVAWVALDYLIKRLVDGGAYTLGQHIAGPFLGLFRITLVHNTGAAWGIFSNSTFALGVFSVVLCVVILAFFLWQRTSMGVAEGVGLALVVGGGVGNAIDRFFLGYVVDLIDFTFIDFPVFNIADIGVTCGIAIFLVAFLVHTFKGEGE